MGFQISPGQLDGGEEREVPNGDDFDFDAPYVLGQQVGVVLFAKEYLSKAAEERGQSAPTSIRVFLGLSPDKSAPPTQDTYTGATSAAKGAKVSKYVPLKGSGLGEAIAACTPRVFEAYRTGQPVNIEPRDWQGAQVLVDVTTEPARGNYGPRAAFRFMGPALQNPAAPTPKPAAMRYAPPQAQGAAPAGYSAPPMQIDPNDIPF